MHSQTRSLKTTIEYFINYDDRVNLSRNKIDIMFEIRILPGCTALESRGRARRACVTYRRRSRDQDVTGRTPAPAEIRLIVN